MNILDKCPSEKRKFICVGITILFTGIFASFSGGYAFFKIFNKEVISSSNSFEDNFLYKAIGMGLIWGFMIFNLDRYIVMSIKKSNNKYKEILTASPRIILAIIISLVVAKPLEVRLFEDRIEAQISDNELTKNEENKERIYSLTGKNKIDDLHSDNEEKVLSLETRLKGNCPTSDCTKAYAAQEKERKTYYAIRNKLNGQIAEADKNIRFIKSAIKFRKIDPKTGAHTSDLNPDGDRRLRSYNDKKDKLTSQRKKAYRKFTAKQNTYNALNQAYKQELESEINQAKINGLALAKEKGKIDSTTNVMSGKASKAANTAFTNNFITQIEALGDLTEWKFDKKDVDGNIIEKANNSMWYISWAIVILFIVIETAPIFVKLISPRGQYDVAMEADDTMKEAGFIHEANNNITISEQKSQLELQILMSSQQAQLQMLHSAIQSWQLKKEQELNNGQLSEEEYKSFIQEVLQFKIQNENQKSMNQNPKSLSWYKKLSFRIPFFVQKPGTQGVN